jgi:large conductance mechanosensitive channel
MPRLQDDDDDSHDHMLQDVREDVTRRAKRIWAGFSDFALQDNVLEVAVGLM